MKRFVMRGVLVAASCLPIAPCALLLAPGVSLAADAVRAEVGKPLQEAATMIKAGRFREALSKVQEAESVSGKTPAESYLVERMRFSAAQGAGDAATAAAALEALSATGRASAAEKSQMELAVGESFYRNKDYAHAETWLDRYRKDGGTDPQARTLLVQAYYLSNDCASVSRELGPVTADSGGRPPSEEDLQLLANCFQKSGDKNLYANAMERLVTYYPKKDYWAELLQRTTSRSGFADRLDLEVGLLKLLTGNLTTTDDYMSLAQLTLEAGLSNEAKKVMDQGFATHAFGTQTDRPMRLQNLITKQIADDTANAAKRDQDAAAAKEGDAMITLGFNKVAAGNVDAGLAQMEQGLAKDNLKRPMDSRLQLGIAYVLAKKRAKANDMLRSVKGTDGVQDVARLWLIYNGSPT